VSADPVVLEYPSGHAKKHPDRAAVIDAASGTTTTYRQLEDRSRAFAHALWAWGLRPGDHLALVMGNRSEFLEICWAAQRIGLYYTAISTHLTEVEISAVLADCGARVLVIDDERVAIASPAERSDRVEHCVAVGAELSGCESYEQLVRAGTGPLPHEGEGEKMLYTSGTTGTPKGVARPLTDGPLGSVFLIRPLMVGMGFDETSVLVTPAPLYHSAPLGYSMGVHRLGGTVVIDRRFDPVQCLETVQKYRATHGLFVPTMFVRMLRVPDRERYDMSSLRGVVHGAAPCPVSVKQSMIDWWGPVLFEYYAATEGAGMTLIDSHEWLAHPGSVGRPVSGSVHIVDDAGDELPSGWTGSVYFAGGARFSYHGDHAKTASAYDARGWATLGDIGHVDDDGYLYLTDRRSFTVISGGVNVYPQEFENLLIGHPAVAEVAAFGVPDDDLGEKLVALVQLVEPGSVDVEELLRWSGERMDRQKLPRVLELRADLPRADNGKLYKRALREDYLRNRVSDQVPRRPR
jgi:long-chain acyl-CoA synthetase